MKQNIHLLIAALMKFDINHNGILAEGSIVTLEPCDDQPIQILLTGYRDDLRRTVNAHRDLPWHRIRSGDVIHWEAREGQVWVRACQMEDYDGEEANDLGALKFPEDFPVIEPGDLCDGPTDLEREQLTAN